MPLCAKVRNPVNAASSRYGPSGSFWLENPGIKALPVLTYEIWNEPDNGTFWKPAPNAGAYATLYTAARNAITAKQGGAHVLIGGLTRPASFLPAMVWTVLWTVLALTFLGGALWQVIGMRDALRTRIPRGMRDERALPAGSTAGGPPYLP